MEALLGLTAGGRVLGSTEPAPLLVLIRRRGHKHRTKTRAVRFAHGQKKVPNLFQDLTPPKPRRHLGDRKFPGVRSKLVGMDYAKDFLERRTLPDARGKKGIAGGRALLPELGPPQPFL